jgi:hypothetical protein
MSIDYDAANTARQDNEFAQTSHSLICNCPWDMSTEWQKLQICRIEESGEANAENKLTAIMLFEMLLVCYTSTQLSWLNSLPRNLLPNFRLLNSYFGTQVKWDTSPYIHWPQGDDKLSWKRCRRWHISQQCQFQLTPSRHWWQRGQCGGPAGISI